MTTKAQIDCSAPDEATSSYNGYFRTKAEARLGWALHQVATHGVDRFLDKPIPPMPGDRPQRKAITRSGDIFARVKEDVPVEELARRFTTLTPVGTGKFKGKCPIHEERTASFWVYQDNRTWRCYGACATGGDLISLGQALMDQGKL